VTRGRRHRADATVGDAKALAAGVREVFGDKSAIRRRTRYKRRNVADHPPEKNQASVDAKLVRAFGCSDPWRKGWPATGC
jgi:protein involved in polysaccharide export with SLBB domain